MLAFLLIHLNEVVALDRLIDVLWGDAPPARATATLQVFISNLRRSLEPDRAPRSPASVLLTRPPGYVLRLHADELDAARFEQLAERGRRLLVRGDAADARDTLTDALSLWRGPALAEFANEAFAQPEAHRLEGLRLLATEDRVQAEIDLGNHRVAAAELEALVAENPLRERLWGMLMLAQYRAGRQAEALRTFQDARRRLGEELGIDPGEALQQLERDILAHSDAIAWQPAGEVGPPSGAIRQARGGYPHAEGRSALVGRHEQLARMDEALHDALAGRSCVVLLSGEPGIGKTRLAQELGSRAGASGAVVAWGHCFEGGPPPFWPWVQVLRALRATFTDTLLPWEQAALGQLLPELQDPGERPSAPVDPAVARFRLYSAVTGVLLRYARRQTVCIVLDDLHWGDPPSLQLLTQLAAQMAGTRLLVAGTFRDTEMGDALAETLAALAREPATAHLSLAGLDVDEVAAFVANVTGAPPSPFLAAALHGRTEGNPFFLTELVRLLESERALSDDSATPLPERVPPGVRDVIRRRLARLPEQTNVLLSMGAVAGAEFDHRMLEAVGGLDEERTLELMEVAIVTGIVTEDAQHVGRYRFSHPLIRQTVYESLSAVRRARLHARVAEGLQALHGDDAVVDVAHHLWCAAEEVTADRTLPVVLRAAEAALGQLAYEQAAEQLRRAAVLLQQRPGDVDAARQELVVQLRLVQLLAMTQGSRSPGAEAALMRAHALTDTVGHEPEFLPALWGLFFALALRCELGSCRRLAGQLLELADRTGDRTFELAGHLGMGITAYLGGELHTADERTRKATAIADLVAGQPLAAAFQMDPATLARALHGHMVALMGRPEAASLVQAAVARAESLGDRLALTIAYLCSCMVALVDDDVDLVDDLAGKAASIAGATGFRGLEALAMSLEAWVLGRQGRLEEASARAREALAIQGVTGNAWGHAIHVAIWAEFERDPARQRAVLQVIDGLLEPDAIGERYLDAELLRLRSELVAGCFPERRAEAIRSAEEAVATARRQGASTQEARAVRTLTRLRAAAG